eukprot:COSAG02_NODE_43868_length_371_cov_0.588235_1_plen_42_part_01
MPRVNRRTFVGQSIAAAGVMTFGTGAVRPISSNDKIGVAVVG